MSFQGGSRAAPAVLTPSQIKAPGDLTYMRLDGGNGFERLFSNALINASFDNWQRGVVAFGAVNGTIYTTDRWRITSGPNGSMSLSRGSVAFGDIPGSSSRYCASPACTGHSAATDLSVVSQPIEGVDTFAGKRVVVRGMMRLLSGPAGSKIAVELEQYFGVSGSAVVYTPAGQVSPGSVWAPFSLIVDVPSIAGKVIGTSNDSLNLNLFLSGGSNFNARTGNLGLQTIGIQLVDVEVKEIKPGYGDSFPGFERIPKHIDQDACYRYYFADFWSIGPAYFAMNNNYSFPIKFARAMRSVPVVGFTNLNSGSGSQQPRNPTVNGFAMQFYSTYGGQDGAISFNYTATAEL